MKIGRQAKIIDLIGKYDIETQEELANYLKQEGFRVTQATISRDIRELKLTKISVGGGRQKYAVLQSGSAQMSDKYLRVLQDGFIGVDRAGCLLIVRTVAGMAMAVAAAVDAMNWQEVAGCIAGDDTIFCACHTEEETAVVLDKLRKIVSHGA